MNRHEVRNSTARKLARALVALVVLTVCLGGIAVGSPASSVPAAPASPRGIPPDIEAACGTDNPYLVTACYFAPLGNVPYRYQDAPAILAFRDTPQDAPQFRLATQPEVGAIWGLAYSRPEHAIYAAAFHKRQVPFGPGGPGAVYRIALDTGVITLFATIPNAGPDRHARGRGSDVAGRDWAGKTSLGDIDLSEDASELAVTNLEDRRIYRLSIPSAQVLGSFPQGAAGEGWAEDARPFGLKYYAGRLFHGVVHSAERSRRATDLAAFVYSSLPDGNDMRQVSTFSLRYPRGDVDFTQLGPRGQGQRARLDWRAWARGYNNLIEPDPSVPAPAVYPMPILADIEFDPHGDMIVGLRDRQSDVTTNDFPLSLNVDDLAGAGFGDILVGRATPDGWDIQLDPEHYDDRASQVGDESGQGGLAVIGWLDQVISAAGGFKGRNLEGTFNYAFEPGAFWYENPSGNKVRFEVACGVFNIAPVLGQQARRGGALPLALDDDSAYPPSSLGDIEVLCGPSRTPPATATPSDTPPPTATATASATAINTAPSTATRGPTVTATTTRTATHIPTPTPLPSPIYLPLALREPPCTVERPRVDVVLVIDASTSMLEPTRAGRSKLDAAREAARIFLDQLDLRGAAGGPPGGAAGDQAALIQFNADARLLQPLTGDRAALQAALATIQPAQFTRIDLGIRAGHVELASPRHLADHQPALIVLTDGRNNPEPVSSAIAAAAEAKAAGMRVFAIGLGEDVETGALVQMASQPGDYFAAPDGEDLAGIYRAIAGAVRPCPATWAGRP